MQLHSLTITAFGPFADVQHVDFDALSAGGLFLFHGPTGAGKTSILDAVCFALYGQVPGARAGSHSLRSDHAAAGLGPEVILEATLRGRRMRLTRRVPRWVRSDGQVTETREVPASAQGATRRLKLTRVAPDTFAVAWAPPTRRVQVRASPTRTVKVSRAPGRTSRVSSDRKVVGDSASAAAGNADAHARTAASPRQWNLLTIPMTTSSAPDALPSGTP